MPAPCRVTSAAAQTAASPPTRHSRTSSSARSAIQASGKPGEQQPPDGAVRAVRSSRSQWLSDIGHQRGASRRRCSRSAPGKRAPPKPNAIAAADSRRCDAGGSSRSSGSGHAPRATARHRDSQAARLPGAVRSNGADAVHAARASDRRGEVVQRRRSPPRSPPPPISTSMRDRADTAAARNR